MGVYTPSFAVRNASGTTREYLLPLNKLDATTAPTVNEDSGDGYIVGSQWVDVTNDRTYFCQDNTLGAAVWKLVGSGSGSGTVTSVDASGGTTGLSFSGGPITTSGTLTLGGTLALANGGLGVSLSDPNADRIFFWDDSAGSVAFLTAGSGLSITGTTITATGTVADADYGDITVSSSGTVWTIDNTAVTFAKFQNISGSSGGIAGYLVGRSAAGSGVATEIQLVSGTPLQFSGGSLVVNAANQTTMEAASSALDVVTPGAFQYSPYALKKSCSFNGTGTPAFLSNVGFTSITDNGTGNWTLNFNGNMSSGSYSVHVSATAPGFGASARFPIYDSTGTSSVQVLYGEVDSGGLYQALDRDEISVTVIGDM